MKQSVYPGVYRGVVEDINDPLNLGRCKIRVPSIHGNITSADIQLLPWARYVSPLPTGVNKGTFITPEVKDIVWVLFEGGSKQYPIYIGSTYGIINNISEVPLEENDNIETTEVLYQSKDVNGKHATIKKTSDYFLFKCGDSSIKIAFDGSINIHASGELNITSDSVINIVGSKVNTINTEEGV